MTESNNVIWDIGTCQVHGGHSYYKNVQDLKYSAEDPHVFIKSI